MAKPAIAVPGGASSSAQPGRRRWDRRLPPQLRSSTLVAVSGIRSSSISGSSAGNTMIEITALGNLSRKLANANLSMNQIAPQILSPQHSSQKDRPFPQFTDVAIQNPTVGISNYYAGMVRIQKHYSRGLSFGANYTWSKYLGGVNMPGSSEGNDAGTYSNYYNR